MSHEIEYARFCIRTPAGFTPFWLHGSSNCTESLYGADGRYHERLERHWSFWCEQVCVSPEELLAYAETFRGSAYGEHWKRGGKWIDDDGVVQWVKSAMKSAVPLEDFLQINHRNSINLLIRYWNDSDRQKEMYNRWIHTSVEFDEWTREAKKIVAREKEAGRDAFLCISLGNREKILVPPVRNGPEKVVVKTSGRYVASLCENEYALSENREEAQTFERQEAIELILSHWSEEIRLAKLMDAEKKPVQQQAVIRVKGAGYFVKTAHSKLFVCHDIKRAKKYPTLAQAEKRCEQLRKQCSINRAQFEAQEIERSTS